MKINSTGTENRICRVLSFSLLCSYLILLWIYPLVANPQGVSYVRYYKDETNFLRGNKMKATDKSGIPHIRVLYNEHDFMLSKASVDGNGNMIIEEIFQYNETGNLEKKSIRNSNYQVERLFIFGDNEEMSRAFIEYAFPFRQKSEFADRITRYDFRPDDEIDGYHFFSVDNTKFGEIVFQYFGNGLIKEERWIRYPHNKTVRLFQYSYTSSTGNYELSEYDSTGQLISHVGLVLPEKRDELSEEDLLSGSHVKKPGNTLDESSEIIRDILSRKKEGWEPMNEIGLLLDKEIQNSPDILYLKNGEILEIDLLKITDTYVRCRLRDSKETLSIPKITVRQINRRDGYVVYPNME